MARFVVGTEDTASSERFAEYLSDRVTTDDVVYAVHSLEGHEEDTREVKQGEDTVQVLVDLLEDQTTVEGHHLIRGKQPAEDLLEFAEERDADEIIVGIHKRSPTGKVIFGSVAQAVLLDSKRPVVALPMKH